MNQFQQFPQLNWGCTWIWDGIWKDTIPKDDPDDDLQQSEYNGGPKTSMHGNKAQANLENNIVNLTTQVQDLGKKKLPKEKTQPNTQKHCIKREVSGSKYKNTTK